MKRIGLVLAACLLAACSVVTEMERSSEVVGGEDEGMFEAIGDVPACCE